MNKSKALEAFWNKHGFDIVGTGGGCTAFEMLQKDGPIFCITEPDDACAPESATAPHFVGIYRNAEEYLQGITTFQVRTESAESCLKEIVKHLYAKTVARMMAEVLEDVANNKVPANVGDFSQLHDHVDANEYGGFCEDGFSDMLIGLFGGRDPNESFPDEMMTFMNDAQAYISGWISSGNMKEALRKVKGARRTRHTKV